MLATTSIMIYRAEFINYYIIFIMTYVPSKFFNELLEGMVPGIHLNNPNSCNDLIHDTHTFVSYFCSFQPA